MTSDARDWSGLVWSVADLLRGDYKQSDYGAVILPMTVLRRVDSLLEPTKADVLSRLDQLGAEGATDHDATLCAVTGLPFYHTGPLTFGALATNPDTYLQGFSTVVADLLAAFDFGLQVTLLRESGLLVRVVERFAQIDLGPRTVSDRQMGEIFEELVRTVAELSSEIAGEYNTPTDVERLMAALLLASDRETGGLTVYDPVCGTGGTLLEATRQIRERNPFATVEAYGQELNRQTYAICRSTMLMKNMNPHHIVLGDTLSQDRFSAAQFDYLIAVPPMGVEWKRVEQFVQNEARHGHAGRFGAGLPRTNDSSLLFLQHMLAKMKPLDAGGSRIAVLFNGSPLHAGAAGSGESDIRRWILENDLLEGVVALPDQLFPNTRISTYVWVLTNRKERELQGRVILLNARDEWQRMRRSWGDKRKYVAAEQVDLIVAAYRDALSVSRNPQDSRHLRLRVLANEDFGYQRVIVERPLRVRFDLTERNHAKLTKGAEGLAAVLRPLIGSSWKSRSKALGVLRATAKAGGQDWPDTASFSALVSRTLRTRDPQGEIQKNRGLIEPDPALSEVVNLPLHRDPDGYLNDDGHPDAWIERGKIRIGYEIRLSHFFVRTLNANFDHLGRFARQRTAKPGFTGEDSGGSGWPHLTAQNLHTADSAVALPEILVSATSVPKATSLTLCEGGDLVGLPGNWRLLPANFGEAVTAMFVLQPSDGHGHVLAEWLNSRPDDATTLRMTSSQLLDTPVPVDMVRPEIEDFLEVVQEGRHKMRATAASTLPNVFAGPQTDVQRLRDEIRSAANEAWLIADLMRPVEDPVGRAEWSYPYHIASLARRYRIGTHPAEQKDGLLKLGEGIARVLGILALSEIAAHGEIDAHLRRSFQKGATFGTWTTAIQKFVESVNEPSLPDLARLADPDGVSALLERIRELRNDTHHSHGIRAGFEIEKDVRALDPHVVAVITSVNWLAGNAWDWVERCEYLDESSYRIVGLTLRGSHPGWEPFDRPSTYPQRPQRVYVTGSGGIPITLWPFAEVSICETCQTRELFLLDQWLEDTLILRSLEEHEITLTYSGRT